MTVRFGGLLGGRSLEVAAGFLIDATGPRGFLHRHLQLGECPLPGMRRTECLYSHFTGVGRSEVVGAPPFAVDDAAVHHVFEGGWVWVLRFKNGITSAGVAVQKEKARELRLDEGAPAWVRLLERVPRLQSQFATAVACQPFRHIPVVSFRSATVAGERWAMLPSAAGFVDPLLSTGFSLTMMGIERLARVLSNDGAGLENYAQQTDGDLVAASRLIGALYATMGNPAAFKAVLLLYFAAVSFSETALRLDKPQLTAGFLLREHPVFGAGMRLLLDRAQSLNGGAATAAFAADVRRLIDPFDVGGFTKPAGNSYPVLAGDLFKAAHKLCAGHDEILAMLNRAGFLETTPPST